MCIYLYLSKAKISFNKITRANWPKRKRNSQGDYAKNYKVSSFTGYTNSHDQIAFNGCCRCPITVTFFVFSHFHGVLIKMS